MSILEIARAAEKAMWAKGMLRNSELCARDLMNERRSDLSLLDIGFMTIDGLIYSTTNGVPVLGISNGEDNLMLRHLEQAIGQLTVNHFYRANPDEARAVLEQPTTTIVELEAVRLKVEGNYCEFEFGTSPSDYNRLNQQERKLVESFYGRGTDFMENMAMMLARGVTRTRIDLHHPERVRVNSRQGPYSLQAELGSRNVDLASAATYSGTTSLQMRKKLRDQMQQGNDPEVKHSPKNPYTLNKSMLSMA